MTDQKKANQSDAEKIAALTAENEKLKGDVTPEQRAAEVQQRKATAAKAIAKQQKLEKEKLAKLTAEAPKVKNLSQTNLNLFGTEVKVGATVPVVGYEESPVMKTFIEREVISVSK